MKRFNFVPDQPFYIGQINIYEYQRTGIRRWLQFLAQLPERRRP